MDLDYLRNLNVWFKLLLFFVFLFGVFVVWSYFLAPPCTDCGTNLTVSIFYNDLIHYVLNHGLGGIFDYAINYLVHYPKLSVYYPPLYHFTVGLFFNLSTSVFTARFVTLLFSMGGIVVTYKVIERLTNKKTALLTSILLGVCPLFIFYVRQVMITIPLYFFTVLTFYLYLKALEENSLKLFCLAGVSLTLSFLTKWMSVVVVPVILLYWYWNEGDFETLKKIVLSLVVASLIASPYLYIMFKFHLPELVYKTPITAGLARNEPQFWELRGWVYYPKTLFKQLSIPLGILSMALMGAYIYRRKRNWKLLSLWILVTYLTFTVVTNKSWRYTIFYLPALLWPVGDFFSKRTGKNRVWVAVFLGLALLTGFFAYSGIRKFNTPYGEISSYVYENTKGNIAFISEDGEMYSGVFTFYMARLDRDLNLSVMRPCIFSHKTESEVKKTIEEKNIYYLIYAPGGTGSENLKKFDDIELERSWENVRLYRVENFDRKEKGYTCNYICVLREEICNNMSYSEIFSKF